jgi:hypothetical protein
LNSSDLQTGTLKFSEAHTGIAALTGFPFQPLEETSRKKANLRSACLRIQSLQWIESGSAIGKFNIYGSCMLTGEPYCIGFVDHDIIDGRFLKG